MSSFGSLSTAPVAGLVLVLLGFASPAHADALQDRLVSDARLASPERFIMARKVTVERRFGKSVERSVQLEEFDPRRPAQERWTLLSKDGRAPTAREVQQFRRERNRDPVPSYARVAVYLTAKAMRSTNPAGQTIYRISELPKGSLPALGSDISQHVSGEATVNTAGGTPYVERMQFTMTEPATLKIVARMERMEAVSNYRMSEYGIPVLASQHTEIGGSMLFRKGTVTVAVEYTGYRPTASGNATVALPGSPSEAKASQPGRSSPQ